MPDVIKHAWTKAMDWIENVVHFVDWLSDNPFPTNKFVEKPPFDEPRVMGQPRRH